MKPMLELTNVSKRFGGLRAVRDVTFTMHEGEILFVIGPNGAGKTTVFNLISGFLHPDEGTIRFNETAGSMAKDSVFNAASVLAKHDENYMPREVVDALKRSGHWQETGAPAK